MIWPGRPRKVAFNMLLQGRLAQLVRAAALHAVGQGFESLVAHLRIYLFMSSVPLIEKKENRNT